jgi:hypothetical protein
VKGGEGVYFATSVEEPEPQGDGIVKRCGSNSSWIEIKKKFKNSSLISLLLFTSFSIMRKQKK